MPGNAMAADGFNQGLWGNYGYVDPSMAIDPKFQLPNMGAPTEGLWDRLQDPNGLGGTLMNAGKLGLSAYLGYKQLGQAEKQLKQNKMEFKSNFNNQAQLLNTQMEDRQAARVASNATGYQSVGSYMDKNKVKGI
jgi:hypothetical protein